ncbi:MAG: hypothetical protein ABI580_02560 [Burkholderiaceae bacterium]
MIDKRVYRRWLELLPEIFADAESIFNASWRNLTPDVQLRLVHAEGRRWRGDGRVVLRRLATIKHAVVTHHLKHAEVLGRGILKEPLGKPKTRFK